MIDERLLRRPDFLEGIPILLADGGSWIVPMPVEQDEHGLGAGASAPVSFGADYADALEAVLEAEDESDALRAELALIICLLRRNYRLDPETLSTILYASGGGARVRMQRAMAEVATAHLRSFRPAGRRTQGASDDRLVRPSPISAFST